MKEQQYVLEWSHASNNFHIQPLADSLAWAQKCFIDNRANNWTTLMIGDRRAVDNFADHHRQKLGDRVKAVRHA
jgi:hypothetical protein